MWLINAQNQRLEQFLGCDVPKYAILSHTWEHEEVTFQEMSYLHASLTNRKGYRKINHACVRALKDGLQYAWVDTCCIDKSNLAELTESINSMYKWYQNAEICYVYLADLTKGVPSREGFKTCRWFTRGWTLQELIAPKHIRFFDQDWECIGDKEDFLDDLYSATSISVDVLSHKRQPSGFSIATRMSWAARRNTTRMEDLAYCLLGIFDVNMPLIYGEGMKAFRRLQEQILMRSNDLTLLAWNIHLEKLNAGDWGAKVEEADNILLNLAGRSPAGPRLG
ncbi:HET-domain-containing protein [Polyplosphaeria fusca]|uniref:HET-domain-containing protein n=1 Tax=Polyplosphaeria fusca TaxID=682080 RepID=A0A9P4R1F0_9PLEO|nr:HET-domain-containing protein [Polyplosphaeria fusca]